MIRLTSWNEAQMDCASQNMTLLQYTHEVRRHGLTLGDFPSGHHFAHIMFLGLKRNSQVFYSIYVLPALILYFDDIKYHLMQSML